MHPDLFRIPIPEFLQGFLPHHITIHSYGLCIALGIFLSYFFLLKRLKKQFGADSDSVTNFVMLLTLAGIIGGKLAFYFENPAFYFGHPANMFRRFGSGFVFYGSFILAVPVMYFYFKKLRWPMRQMLDNMAFVVLIVHGLGRIGCFLAGCCHGIRTESWIGVTYTNPKCAALPLNTPLHPTQLYEAGLLLIFFIVIYLIRNKKQYNGQLFIIYAFLYAVGRFLIEFFRGDHDRGYLFNDAISHSQFIALILVVVTIFAHLFMYKRYAFTDKKSEK
jgi:phosphatidylglycerol:prolipoprotein diacylglycerol transferase